MSDHKYEEFQLEFAEDYFDIRKYRTQNPNDSVKAVINGAHGLIIVILRKVS